MFPRSASSLENPQENCLKSYWPALMQFLMKIPPIIRLTGAGCCQCLMRLSAMVHDLPGERTQMMTTDHREVTFLSWADISLEWFYSFLRLQIQNLLSLILTTNPALHNWWFFSSDVYLFIVIEVTKFLICVEWSLMILLSAGGGVTPGLTPVTLCQGHPLFTGTAPCSLIRPKCSS